MLSDFNFLPASNEKLILFGGFIGYKKNKLKFVNDFIRPAFKSKLDFYGCPEEP